MELHTNATQARRYVHRPKPQRASYQDQIAKAKEAARAGYGFEDLVQKFGILERDARQIVFGDHR